MLMSFHVVNITLRKSEEADGREMGRPVLVGFSLTFALSEQVPRVTLPVPRDAAGEEGDVGWSQQPY